MMLAAPHPENFILLGVGFCAYWIIKVGIFVLRAVHRIGGLEMATPSSLAPSSLAQWFGAVGTILAVIVALFKDSIRDWRRKPRLDAICKNESPWTIKTPISVTQGGTVVWQGECYYARLEVKNSGKTRADKVQVYASKLREQGLNEEFSEIRTFLPLNMKWANSPPGGAVIVLDGISPAMSAFCDVASLCDPANPHQGRRTGVSPGTTIGQLQLEVEPFIGSHLLAPGTYRLTLRIAAANAKPIDKIFTFTIQAHGLPTRR